MNRKLKAKRLGALLKPKKAEKKVAENVPEKVVPEVAPKEVAGINQIDPETGNVVATFPSIEAAAEAGFNKPNLSGAIKNGTKYKGHLWAKVK